MQAVELIGTRLMTPSIGLTPRFYPFQVWGEVRGEVMGNLDDKVPVGQSSEVPKSLRSTIRMDNSQEREIQSLVMCSF